MRSLRSILALSFLLLGASAALAQSPGARQFRTSQVSVTNTATLVADTTGSRQAITVQNLGATAMYCGPASTVTTANGFRLPGVDGASFTLLTQSAVYCITAAGSQAVSVVEAF